MKAIEALKERAQWVAWTHNKIPISPRGTRAKSTDPQTWGTLDEAKFIRGVQGLPGVGFVISDNDPFVGIDLDDAIDPVTDELRPWAREIVDELDSYTELSPSGLGVHIWVRGDIPRNGAKSRDGWKVEAYKTARYFTVTGRPLPGTRDEIREVELGPWFARIFGASTSEPTAKPDQMDIDWEAPGVEEWLGEALTYIDADDYHEWVRIGLAIKSELGDRGFVFWDHWSRGSTKYPGHEQAWRKWQGFGYSGEVSIASIVWLAERRGFRVPRGPRLPPGFEHGWEEWLAAQGGIEDPDGVAEGLSIVLHDAADMYLDDTPPEPDLIGPGVLGAGDLALLFGPPKAMKSMVVMDMFRQFALGRDWCGFTVDRQLRTLYAQFEVKGDKMRERLQLAPMSREDIERMRGHLYITERFTPVLNAEFVMEFSKLALETFKGKLDVLVLDPLANIYSGESENDNAQMATFLRQLKILRNRISPDVAIVLVHHAGKRDRSERAAEPFNAIRGASALRGAYDAGLYLDREKEDSPHVKMWCELRNGPRRAPFEMAFDQGRFRLVTEEEKVEAATAEEPIDAERLVIEDTLRSEAAAGRLYTAKTFADVFGGGALGQPSTIRRHLGRLETLGAIAYFRELPGVDLEQPHHRVPGYLWCEGMEYADTLGELHEVRPQLFRDPHTGKLAEAGYREL